EEGGRRSVHAHQAIVSRPGAFQGKGAITEQKLDDQGHGPECIAFRSMPGDRTLRCLLIRRTGYPQSKSISGELASGMEHSRLISVGPSKGSERDVFARRQAADRIAATRQAGPQRRQCPSGVAWRQVWGNVHPGQLPVPELQFPIKEQAASL